MQNMTMRIAALVAGMVGALVFVAPAQAAPQDGISGWNPCTYSMSTRYTGKVRWVTMTVSCPGVQRVTTWRITPNGKRATVRH